MPPPSSARCYLVGRIGSYDVRDVARTDTCLRELVHRLKTAQPQTVPRIWADVDKLLEHRLMLMKRGRP